MKKAFQRNILGILAATLLSNLVVAAAWAQTAQATVIDADVVVIGGGTAGISAAVTALQAGAAKVIVVEKQPYVGGNSALAGGMLYTPTNTSLPAGMAAMAPSAQAVSSSLSAGPGAAPSQTPEQMRDAAIKETLAFHHYDRVNAKLLSALIDKSMESRKWFSAMGTNVDANAGAPGSFGKTISVVSLKFAAMGGQTLLDTTARKILKDATGKVTGVLAAGSGGKLMRINAPAVVLASGGFTGNPALLKKYFPYYSPDKISTEASLTNMGEGIQLAADAGADLAEYATLIKENGFSFKTGSPINNRISMSASLWINKRGERFIDETLGHDDASTNALIAQPGMSGYAIYDEDQIEAMGTGNNPGVGNATGQPAVTLKEKLNAEAKQSSAWVKISDNWDGIAAWLGADPKTLKATVDEYDRFCDQGSDPVFGKEEQALIAVRKAPFYAIKFGPLMIDTVGPVIINERMEVLDKQGKPIPGFYAAGVITSGWQGHDYHLFGSALGLSTAGGRIAGENAEKLAAARKSAGAASGSRNTGASK
jgi:fumarate reductase flavoprotein subunit